MFESASPSPSLPLSTEIFLRSPTQRLRTVWIGLLIWWYESKRRALWSALGLWWPACCSRLLLQCCHRRACFGISSQKKPSGSGSWHWTLELSWTGLVGEKMDSFYLCAVKYCFNKLNTDAAAGAHDWDKWSPFNGIWWDFFLNDQ